MDKNDSRLPFTLFFFSLLLCVTSSIKSWCHHNVGSHLRSPRPAFVESPHFMLNSLYWCLQHWAANKLARRPSSLFRNCALTRSSGKTKNQPQSPTLSTYTTSSNEFSSFAEFLNFLCRPHRGVDMEMPGYLPKLLFELNEQRKRDFFCDCSILVEGRVFKAHRNVLFAGSGYFRALLVHYLQVTVCVWRFMDCLWVHAVGDSEKTDVLLARMNSLFNIRAHLPCHT